MPFLFSPPALAGFATGRGAVMIRFFNPDLETTMTANPIGTKAYYDTFSGLIPCITLGWSSNGKLRFKLTASRGPYKRGEILESTPIWVPPRSAVRRKRHSSTIGHYKYAKQ